jgi:ABC-type Na+ efflux pump permease subunit
MQRSSGFMVYLALPSISAAPLDQGLDAVQDPVQAEDELVAGVVSGFEDTRLDRFRSLDVSGTPPSPDFAGAVAVLLLFVLAVSWLCAALGLLVSSPEAANSAMFLMFIAYASRVFAPVRAMPRWLRGFAANQPITPVIETVRGLLLGHPAGSHLWLALAWCSGIMIVSAASSAALFQRRTR